MGIDQVLFWYWFVFVFIIGACVGSFLNVVIYRLPAGISVVKPRSQCKCGEFIKWYDNIPIFSWFLLGGKCRACKAKFSIRYSLIELGTALLFSFFYLQYSLMALLPLLVFLGLMIPAAFIDLDTMEIPDRFTIGGFIVGVCLSLFFPLMHGQAHDIYVVASFNSFILSLQGAFIGSGLILWVALVSEVILRKETMGFGDVKLMGAIGAFCGWEGAVFSLFGGAVLGTVVLAISWPFIRNRINRDEEEGLRIPFGPSLIGGALVYLLLLRDPVDNYFAEIVYLLGAL